jgi:hypothetical protein
VRRGGTEWGAGAKVQSRPHAGGGRRKATPSARASPHPQRQVAPAGSKQRGESPFGGTRRGASHRCRRISAYRDNSGRNRSRRGSMRRTGHTPPAAGGRSGSLRRGAVTRNPRGFRARFRFFAGGAGSIFNFWRCPTRRAQARHPPFAFVSLLTTTQKLASETRQPRQSRLARPDRSAGPWP